MPAFEVALSRIHAIQKEQALGLCFVFCVAVIWVAASFLVQDLEARGINPFVLTYIANTLFLVLLPVSALSRKSEVASTPKYVFAMHCWCTRCCSCNAPSAHRSPAETAEPEDKRLLVSCDSDLSSHTTPPVGVWRQSLGTAQLRYAALVVCFPCPTWLSALPFTSLPYSVGKCLCNHVLVWPLSDKFIESTDECMYMQVAPLWFGAQLTFNFSLSMTNVTSNTILSSTSSLFTFGLSCLLLGETYTSVKLLSIMVCIAGTFLDSSTPSMCAARTALCMSYQMS